jgi:hypothetical protein
MKKSQRILMQILSVASVRDFNQIVFLFEEDIFRGIGGQLKVKGVISANISRHTAQNQIFIHEFFKNPPKGVENKIISLRTVY